jgi:hypothetical protein
MNCLFSVLLLRFSVALMSGGSGDLTTRSHTSHARPRETRSNALVNGSVRSLKKRGMII